MTTGATRAYRRVVLTRILSPLDGKAFHLDTLCRARRAGLRLREVPATLRWHESRRTRRSFGGGRQLGAELLTHLQVLWRHVYTTKLAP
jgi:GT2 family glycosyltransferase